ncbi:mannitol dehydrogenase family protein [Bauldia sp.]|uniref:mannitol dehydrogenase family protein n=1 Tax=Bauldia sp. TaxID=2575872 RepID=UPI003BAB53DD
MKEPAGGTLIVDNTRRLNAATLSTLPASIAKPTYDRTRLTPGTLHLGSGAFHRAHLMDFTEDALHADFGPWGVIGVNLRPPDLGVILEPQDGLYCRQLRAKSAEDSRIVGALLGGFTVLDAGYDPHHLGLARALDLASRATIRVISMTVTEKGYCHIPATGHLNPDHPDIVHDVANPRHPRSVPGFALEVIRRRFAASVSQPVFMSCDNVPGNGTTLKTCVLELAGLSRPELVAPIEDQVVFLNTMVDRIAPATRPEDIAAFRGATGVADFALAVGEPFRMWAIEKDDRARLPAWDAVGAMIVDNVADYETIKMRVVNGMQTGTCHLGHMAGYAFMADVFADPLFSRFARRTVEREVAPNLPKVAGIDLPAYIAETVKRLENPALRHGTAQISTDGSRKVRQRLLEPLYDARRAGLAADGLTLAVAGWIAHLIALSGADRDPAIADPILETARSLWAETGKDPAAFVDAILSLHEVFPERIASIDGLGATLVANVIALRTKPVREVLAGHLADPG